MDIISNFFTNNNASDDSYKYSPTKVDSKNVNFSDKEIKKIISTLNTEASEILSKIVDDVPCTNATTYHIRELPYHSPPEIYKFSLSKEGKSVLLQRKNTWKHDNLTQVSKGGKGGNGVTGIVGGIAEELDDFHSYYTKHRMYPKVEYKLLKNASLTDIFHSNHRNNLNWEKRNLILKKNNFVKNKYCFLNPSIKWLWVLNMHCEFIFCPEVQLGSSETRNDVKHGDMVASQRNIGSVDHLISGRGPARMGGEIYYDEQSSKWCINNDSSYCFFRQDKQVLSNGRGFKWHDYINALLLHVFGIDTNDILWIDRVQSRQLDGYIIQNVAFRFQRYKNKQIKLSALEQVSVQQQSEEYEMVKHFKDVNLASLMLGAFGVDALFLTEGKLKVRVLQGENIPYVKQVLEYPNRYCKLKLMGCEEVIRDKWWYKSETTKSIPSPPNIDIYWHSQEFTFYVTSYHIEVLVIDIYQEPEHKLGSCLIEIRNLIPNQKINEWYPIIVSNEGNPSNGNKVPRIGLSLSYETNLKHQIDLQSSVHMRNSYIDLTDLGNSEWINPLESGYYQKDMKNSMQSIRSHLDLADLGNSDWVPIESSVRANPLFQRKNIPAYISTSVQEDEDEL